MASDRSYIQAHSIDNSNVPKMKSDSDAMLAKHWTDLLVLVATERDQLAFSQLFHHFAPKIQRLTERKLQDQATALDVTQEIMSRVWHKAHMFDASRGAASTWIYTIMRNVIFDTLRKVKGKPTESLSDDIWPLDERLCTTQTFDDHLMSRKLDHLVQQLPKLQQEALKAVYFKQMTQDELAKQLKVSVGTIKSRIRLAVTKLKQQLGEHHD